MADFWIEVHCDMRVTPGFERECWTNRNDNPGMLIRAGQFAAGAALLRIHGTREGWKFPRGKALCPACSKRMEQRQ